VIDSGPQGEIDYSNINFQWSGNDDRSPKSELTYSYYLENYHDDYTPFGSETSKVFAGLPEGSYTFYVQAQDREGNIDPSPAKQAFTITTPYDIVVRPGLLAEGEKIFLLRIPLPAYKLAIRYRAMPIIEEPKITCWIGDHIPFWIAESDGETYICRAKVEYKVLAKPATPEGVYDLTHKYRLTEGGRGRELGVIEFKIRVKVSKEATAQAPETEETAQAPPSGKQLLYEDDYNDPSSGWIVESTEDHEVYYENGEYHGLVKRSQWAGWSCNRNAGIFTDFIYEFDARLIGGAEGSDYGSVFRYRDDDSFYCFLVGDGYYSVWAVLNGKWTELQYWTKSAFIKKGNSTNHLKVVCKGPQIQTYVNGHHLTTVTDGSFADGYVGGIIQTGESDAHVAFDNTRVYSLD